MNSETKIPSYKENLKDLISQLKDMLPTDKFAVFNNDADSLALEYSSELPVKIGDQAHRFALPNAMGNTITLDGLLQNGPVVLSFYRGIWCPYCNLQLKNYQQVLPQIKQLGANLVAVSPMTPDNSLGMKETNALEFEVLSDVGNQVAEQFTTVFKNSDAPIQTMSELGYDFFSFYDDDSATLPVPATFVINSDGNSSPILFPGLCF